MLLILAMLVTACAPAPRVLVVEGCEPVWTEAAAESGEDGWVFEAQDAPCTVLYVGPEDGL